MSKFGFCEYAGRAVSKVTANGMANRTFLIDSPLVFLWMKSPEDGPAKARKQTEPTSVYMSRRLAVNISVWMNGAWMPLALHASGLTNRCSHRLTDKKICKCHLQH